MAVISKPNFLGNAWQITPAVVPTEAVDVVATDVYVEEITLSNTSGSAATVTIKDKQGTPRSILEAVSIAANTTYVITFPKGRYMPGGVNWVASAGSVVGYICGRY